MTIKRNSDAGKALVDALGDGSRAVVLLTELEAKAAKIAKVIGDSIPMLFAGGSAEAVANAGTESVIIGLVAQQRKESEGKAAETFYTAVLVTPLFSVATLLADEGGKAWLEKIVEKESAHVSFRPIRNSEEGESLEGYAERVPVTLSDLVTAAARDKIDTEALEVLWPYFRLSIQTMAKNKDASAAATLAFLPGAKAIPTVSKALRSKDWAVRNTPDLEKAGFWAQAGRVMLEVAKGPVPNPSKPEDRIEVDASVIAQWLDGRDATIIEPPVARAAKDHAGLEAFIGKLSGAGAGATA